MKQNSTYKQAAGDYFYRFFKDGINVFILPSIVSAIILMNPVLVNPAERNWMAGVPILFAMLSGSMHRVSLPVMMYFIPYTKKQREDYIQKMLYMKILVPLCFGIIWDMAALFVHQLSLYAWILQLFGILLITYIFGTFNDTKKAAYGKAGEFTDLTVCVCCYAGMVLFMICTDSISRAEFYIILSVTAIIFLPVINAIRKRWKTIKSNFADYEMVMDTEVKPCR